MFYQSIKTESEMLNFKPQPGMLHPVFPDELPEVDVYNPLPGEIIAVSNNPTILNTQIIRNGRTQYKLSTVIAKSNKRGWCKIKMTI